MASSFEMGQYMASVGTAIGTSIAASMKQTVNNSWSRSYSIQADNSMKTFNSSISGNFYIRPFYNNGWNMFVVNINDGSATTIPVCDHNDVLQINSSNLATFLFIPEENLMVYKSYYSDKYTAEKYIQKAMYPGTTGLFGKKAELTYPFLTTIDLSKLEYHPYEEFSI